MNRHECLRRRSIDGASERESERAPERDREHFIHFAVMVMVTLLATADRCESLTAPG